MKNIIRILRISKPLHLILYLLSGLIVLAALLELLFPLITKAIVDEISLHVSTQEGSLNRLLFLIGLGFVVNISGSAISSASGRLGDHFAGKIRKFLTERFYDKILTLPQKYFDGTLSGKITNQLSRGIQTIQDFMNTATNFVVPSILQAVLTLAILAYYSVPIAFFLLLLFPIYIYLSYLSTQKWGELEVKKNKYEDVNRGRIHEVISNIRVVKSFTTELAEYKQVSMWLTKINKIYAKQSGKFHFIDFLRNLSLHLVLLVINLITFYSTFIGRFTLGEMVLILQLIMQARRPLFAMSFILTRIQQAESGSKEYFEIMDLASVEFYRNKKAIKRIKNPEIVFDDVDFKYEDAKDTIKKLSMKIMPKEKVALVGHSGAGKSTIVNLILKFYEISSGEIYINGYSYADVSHRFIREQISLVFQENELFSTTIAENVAYGSPAANREDVVQALKKANAWGFVQKLAKGLDSEVGERGVRLSGGQKQRIQIARAILKNAPILILDEATSSLDSRSEHLVQSGLENLMKDKTVIIIAHRFSTIQNVDKVFVIDDGELVAYGAPRELAARPGIYSELLRYQVEGNKKLLANFELY